ncbi:MAG: HIT family protein [Actinomycetota bacterium]|nr:HIT family protein [Actinomycetota bacterium]
MTTDCILCRGADADPELGRVEVWEDELWRLSTSIASEVAGFSYLEPKRHISHITDLDGDEAATFGSVVAMTTRALKDATGAEVVYVYVFGEGVPHLHLHLAPHREGDPLNSQMIKGELTEEKQPSGVTFVYSKDYPPLPEADLRDVADAVRRGLAG